MSALSDLEIRDAIHLGEIAVTPLDETAIQPASIDLRLGSHFTWFAAGPGTERVIDPQEDNTWRMASGEFTADEPFLLMPHCFALGTTVETVALGCRHIGRLEGKSSLARLGLAVHITAGFFDPGFRGECTFEFINYAPAPMLLRPGMRIAQMSFQRLGKTVDRAYGHPDLGSKYQDQKGATPSAYHQNEVVTPPVPALVPVPVDLADGPTTPWPDHC